MVHLCSVNDDPAACLFITGFFSLLGHFHLPFHMINVATRVTMVTANDNSASMPIKAFGPIATPRAAKCFLINANSKSAPGSFILCASPLCHIQIATVGRLGGVKGGRRRKTEPVSRVCVSPQSALGLLAMSIPALASTGDGFHCHLSHPLASERCSQLLTALTGLQLQ